MHPWTPEEERFLRSLNTPDKIQRWLDGLGYHADDNAASVRYVLMTKIGHCFEGAFVAAAALEFQGYKPQIVHLVAHDDDYHALTVYKTKTGWGCCSKSNTSLLTGRYPVYRTIRELVMSYFDFYFNLSGRPSLYSYSMPIPLDRYKRWNWRTGDEDLIEFGHMMSQLPHYECTDERTLRGLAPVTKRVYQGCLKGADMKALYVPKK